ARMRSWRRSTLRYKNETVHIERWLERILDTAPNNYGLAVEIARLQRLVKGYGDTHARGWGNFNKIVAVIDNYEGEEELAQVVRQLREAALADEGGGALAQAISAITDSGGSKAAITDA